MLELVNLSYSPWSERARWALDHHRLEYRSKPYTPMIGETALRLRLRRWSGRVTVPVLFADDVAIRDSTEIARYADRIGGGTPLISGARENDVLEWILSAERALEAGRNLVTRRTARSGPARIESLPAPLRGSGALGSALADSGVRFFMRKYDLDARNEEDDVGLVASFLDALRNALDGRQTLFDEFSFADIVASNVLQVVEPVGDRFVRLGPATRAVWATPELIERYRDLVEWRDGLYQAHRITDRAAT